jgi:sporulation protein YlmC with PRC-barrel domain
MDSMKHRRLQELDRSDFQIVDGDPDIRGWDVRNNNGRKIGEVEELIVDAKEKKVRYMVVDLDDNELKLNHKKVLVPIGLAELDRKDDDVLIPNVSPQQFGELPEYDRDNLTADAERTVFTTLERQTARTAPPPSTTAPQPEAKSQMRKTADKKEKGELDPEFYRHEYYNVDNLYKNRLHEAKSVKSKNETEYERGLRLWERRSDGGVLPGDSSSETGAETSRASKYRELDEETRNRLIRDRRDSYQQRRYRDTGPTEDTNNTNEQARDENLPPR